jgi:hypothetical protein
VSPITHPAIATSHHGSHPVKKKDGRIAIVGVLFCLAFVVICVSLWPQTGETRALVKADRLVRTAGEGHLAH